MKIISLWEYAKAYVGLPAKASAAGNENGTALDKRAIKEFFSGGALINVGDPTGSPTSFQIIYRVQHSDAENGTYADVATATVTATGVYQIGFDPGATKRWVRLRREVSFSGGSSPTALNGASLILGDPKYGPA